MEQTVAEQPGPLLAKESAAFGSEEKEMRSTSTGSECKWRSKLLHAETQAILTQPGLGVTTTTVTTIIQTGGGWSTDLLDVCGDKSICLLGAFLPCCLELSLANQYGECVCLPLLPGSTFALRVGIRERYKIRGSVCDDWAAVCCCYPLAMCQMMREMKLRMRRQMYHVSTALECS
ncbi:cornifelin [Genypterus blacodes]|uniref:cornifelin n=1 Tax=Genypterus blacodes TaxID=154954 RepID=UPI003F775A2D